MGNYYGYVILAIFAVVFIGISVFVSKNSQSRVSMTLLQQVEEFHHLW